MDCNLTSDPWGEPNLTTLLIVVVSVLVAYLLWRQSDEQYHLSTVTNQDHYDKLSNQIGYAEQQLSEL